MSKVCRVGIPVKYKHISNEVIRDSIEFAGKYPEMIKVFKYSDNMTDYENMNYITKKVRLNEDERYILKKLSIMYTSYPQTRVSAILIDLYAKEIKERYKMIIEGIDG